MVATTVKQFLPILGIVLVSVIVSMLIVSFFNVNLAETRGMRSLNKAAIYEGMSALEEEEKHEGMTGMEEEEKEEDKPFEGMRKI